MKCFYCETEIAGKWDIQRDHFPIPRARGGTETVNACSRCHHYKDRARREELRAKFDAELKVAPDFVVLGWNNWLDVAETCSTADTWVVAQGYWHSWPLWFRLTAGRIMAQQES